MSGNTFGHCFRVTTAGESHGPGYVGIIDGVPAGLALSEDDLLPDMNRRRPGQSKITTQRNEGDTPEILSGVFEGYTTGTSIAILVRNTDQRSKDYSEIRDKYRPGHADYTFDAKYGARDYRGGGRSSARETTVRVAAGAIAKKLLRETFGVRIVGYVRQVGELIARIEDPAAVTLDQVEANAVRCPDPDAAQRMIELIERMRSEQDSIGGLAELVATNVPAGWGEPVFDKLKADLGKAMFSLPAVVGVEYGAGFDVATMRGSEHNDAFTTADEDASLNESGDDEATERSLHAVEEAEHETAPDSENDQSSSNTRATSHGARIVTRTNRHGGMLGGISSGMPIVMRCAVKPTSSLPQPQDTVTTEGEPTTISTKGRHDPCLLPRFVPMGEAMMAITLADHMLRQRVQGG